MDAETMVSNSPTIISSPLNKYKKKKSITGSIPTLIESVLEHPDDDAAEEEEREHDFVEVGSVPKNVGSSLRKGSLSLFPRNRKGSLGLSSLFGMKNKTDPNISLNNSREIEDDSELSPLPTPRRSSIAVLEDRSRRKSWATKLQIERRRRQSGGEDEVPEEVRGKRRPSWWNNLVPENLLKTRSRRASQQLSRSDESITQLPYRRSKSRSVDHGFAPPFDLDSLRSKVEGRFDAVQRDEDETVKRIPPVPPIKTTTYVVQDRDTLTSVAARFDTTPSELSKLNRLGTNFIFPSQNLLVPDKTDDSTKEDAPSEGGEQGSDGSSHQNVPSQEKDILDNLRPVSPELPSSPAAPQRFLKINVRHITDGQGVVSGVLLVTPNAVMFDPNVSDTLVLEHGPESYGVIAPMEFVVNAAIYYDIAHMRTHDSNPNINRGEKPEIYYMNKNNSPGKDSLVKDETFPELAATTVEGDLTDWSESLENRTSADGEEEIETSTGDTGERGGDAFPKAFDRELVTPTSAQQRTEERRRSLLDHHWAVPNKERMSIDITSEVSSSSGDCIREEETQEIIPIVPARPAADLPALHLVKLSCHDSGIDIRDPLPAITPNNTKKVYSDADIVLSQDWVPPVAIVPVAEPPLSAPPMSSEERVKKHAAVSFSLDNTTPLSQDVSREDPSKGEKKNKMLKRLSYPLTWMEGLAGDSGGGSSGGSQGDSLPTSADSHNSGSVFSKVFNRRSSYGGFGRTDSKKVPLNPAPRLDYRSMVSVDDMPELFVSFDKLIPRPARSCDDPPLYLRLRMGRPANKAVPRSTPLMSYGRKRMRPEYWFSVPRNRVDDLYKFLNHWVPELYGELGDVTERGYILVDSDTELSDDETGTVGPKGERSDSQGDVGDLTRESWELLKAPYVKIYSILKSQGLSGDSDEHSRDEVLSMSDELRRALYSSGASVDMEFSPPDLIGTTEILTLEHREKLCAHLPARAQGYMWSLVFSSIQHGFSLNSMYRKMQRVDSPVLLIVQDTDNHVFGALTSCALHPSEHFYGTGESFLFSFCANKPDSPAAHRRSISTSAPTATPPPSATIPLDASQTTIVDESEKPPEEPQRVFRVWQWTGDNLYFIRGSNDNISIGAGDGKFGLWLDGDLYQGRTQSCTTYGNEPLSTQEDFIVKTLECWAFI
ncbi:TLD domain-containing protein mustard isoform X3 [Arctopsyche grandis]|uniref:TLD domain-containing protein mustard isoform X3 n=1 Tax=Arctopsyche grandis TaxID=121162 RepID=UPI00406D8DF5